jgi:DNA (cytosine-5)-methyltransferase 1
MNGSQLNLYDMAWEQFKITKPIRLIELFSGIGSQALALKYLGVPFEHWKTCEWAVKSIQAYKDIHFTDKDIELNSKRTKEEMIEFLYQKGISSNYNEPMTKEQIKRLSEQQLKTIIKNIAITHNLVNIQQVKGKDLEIVDTDKYDYILTYSFPCQDLSLAGKGEGMSDTSTRSGMLWEVERILQECKDLGELPQILLMENVPQVHSQDNLKDFNKWKLRLEELGYNNYFQDLIATDYGIPQTSNRCFMVSILGDYSYTFPKPIPLKLKLKDMLEDNVDEKYYLSDKMINYLTNSTSSGGIDRGESFNRIQDKIENDGIAATITTNAGNRATDNFIKVKNATKQGYLEATVVVNMKTKLCNELIEQGKVKENDVIRHSYTTSRTNDWNKRGVEQNNISPTLDTRCDCLGVVNNMRIRKLTPKECGRLMGVKDEDIDKISLSDSAKYHIFGDAIVVNVLMAIFKEMI